MPQGLSGSIIGTISGLTAPGPSLQKSLYAFEQRIDPADARPHDDADVVAIFIGDFQAGIFQTLVGGKQAKLRDPVRAAVFTAAQKSLRVEILDLAAKVVFQVRGVKECDRTDAGLARRRIGPGFINRIACRADDAHAGYDYSSSFHLVFPPR